MHIVHPRCCGLDVHKASLSACILLVGDEAKDVTCAALEP
jgi:hypothetical protein